MVGRRAVLFLQRNEYFAVHRTDGGRITQRDIDAAIRQADIVQHDVDLVAADDLVNRALDFGEITLRLLEPARRRRTNVKPHLAGVDLREEVSSQLREKKQRACDQQHKEAAGDARAPDAKSDIIAIAFAQAVEAVFETVVNSAENIEPQARGGAVRLMSRRMGLKRGAHQISKQHRHQREGEHKARDQRHADRQRQRREQIFGRALQKEYRHEHDANADRRQRGRNRHFAATGNDRLTQRIAVFDVTLDILDHDRTVVDENADRKREAAERHRIQGLAADKEDENGGDDRNRNRRKNDERQAPIAEKQQNHQPGQSGRDQPAHQHAVERGVDENRLIENRLDVDAWRHDPRDVRQHLPDAVDHRQRRDPSGLAHRHQGARAAVDAHRIGLGLKAVMNVGDVAQEHDPALLLLDRKLIDRRDRVGAVVEGERVILAADFDVASRKNDVLLLDRARDIGRRQSARGKRLLIEIHHDDARLAAVRIRDFRAMNDSQIRANDVLAEIVQFGVGQRAGGKAELDDRDVGRTVTQHQSRRDVGRHVFQNDKRAARELRDGARHVGAFVEIHFDDADAAIARGLDPADVVHQRGELSLVQSQNAVADVLRAHSAVGPDDADDGNIDLGENIDRHAQRGADAHQANKNQRGDDRVRSPQREC